MNISRALGLVLKQLRIAKGLTQDDLSAASGYTREHISRIELGKSEASLTALFDLADTLDVRPSDIIKRVEKKSR